MTKPSDSTITYLSRSALADKLEVSLKELTQLMIEAGWIKHNSDAPKGKEWMLTNKGEFEGGIYRESKKFGQYLVWPEAVLSHPAITGLKETLISASIIAKHFSASPDNISAKIVNKLLAEMAWITPFAKGWQVTEMGKRNGAVQQHNDETGVPYVMWSRKLLENPHLIRNLQYLQLDTHIIPTKTVEGITHFQSLDGGLFTSIEELNIAQYLYLSGISYAYQRHIALSQDDIIIPTFYLASENIYVFFNPAKVKPAVLAEQLAQQALLEQYHLKVITLHSDDITHLDQVLSKALLQLGVVLT